MANKATVNASPETKALRNVGRIKTLRLAIERAKTPERRAALQEELDRRVGEIDALRAALDSVDA